MIPIEVRSKSNSFDGDLVPFVEHRMRLSMDRVRDLRRVVVSIEDVNGPRGGPDKHCRVMAEFGFASLVAEETQPTWQSAVARAIHRIARNAVRVLRRVNRAPLHGAHRIPRSAMPAEPEAGLPRESPDRRDPDVIAPDQRKMA
jgi:putative sigma-54 modulation protein